MIEKRIYTCGCWSMSDTLSETASAGFCASRVRSDGEDGQCEQAKVELDEWLDKQLSGIGVTGDELNAAIDRAKRLGVVVVLGEAIEAAEADVAAGRVLSHEAVCEALGFADVLNAPQDDPSRDAYRRGYDGIDWSSDTT